MLYHMRNKPALAGRLGKSGLWFRLILNGFSISLIRPVIAIARIPQACRRKLVTRRADRLCAAGQTKLQS